jgi:DNA polymerase-3 subunit alpha
MMFGEDWLKYRHLITRGGKLFVVGRVQPKRFGQDISALEFRINRIELLGDIRKKMGRYLDIFIPMHRLNDELIERIATSLENGTGKAQVRMRVMHEQSELLLPSNSFNKVNIEAEALKALQDIPEIEFEVSES